MYKVVGILDGESWLVAEFENKELAEITKNTAQRKALSYWRKKKFDMVNTTDPNWKCTEEKFPVYHIEELQKDE